MTSPSARRVILAPLLIGLAAIGWLLVPLRPALAPSSRTIRIEAGNFEYFPSQLTVQRGDRVTLELVARDVVHGLHLDGYAVDITADPGQTARATFVADHAGTFTFRCSIPCGPLHPFMIGKLRVDPSDTLARAAGLALLAVLFGAWLARAKADIPATVGAAAP
ncbi:MAG TPA: cupredoxin domain-containing protein [Anaerolineales bacterium]|nr:cupredoxin domain-containing protein [Anaerolineales bacterium]